MSLDLIGECFDVATGGQGHNFEPLRPERFNYTK